ncbi:GNAT family acetyltransferase [Phenylobacterium sp.]|jgi:arginine exporter protein ArgO|uniref:GNAT family acetyltransferase n=1 Tax=Phenylobacterium sp. TaxID=1871053 RepID=UPI002F9542FB
MNRLAAAFYTLASLVLMAFAAVLVATGPVSLISALMQGKPFVTAMVNSLGYLILSLAVFDVARYVYDEEVRRGREMRKAAETRRSITKFITVIIIAVLMDALVALSKAGQSSLDQLVYPVVLILGGVALLLGLGIFQRLSATVEEKVGAADDADEAEHEG